MRWRSIGAAVVLLVFLPGCPAPWQVLRRVGPPGALAGATGIVLAFDASQVRVDRAPAGALPEGERADVDQAFTIAGAEMLAQLSLGAGVPVRMDTGPLAPGEVRLVAVATELERGGRGPFGASTVLVVRQDWYVGDEPVVSVLGRTAAPPLGPRHPETFRVLDRMRTAGGDHGALAARFFRSERGR